MNIELEKEGVVAKVTADETGHVTAIDVSVEPIKFSLNLWFEEVPGARLWKLAYSSGGFVSSEKFEILWEHLPTFVAGEGTERFPVFSVVAEIVDSKGVVTEPTSGISAVSQATRETLKMFTNKYTGRELVALLRPVLALHGYGVRPNIGFIRHVGECAAYHEVGSAIFDKMTVNNDIESMLTATRQWLAFKNAVSGPETCESDTVGSPTEKTK